MSWPPLACHLVGCCSGSGSSPPPFPKQELKCIKTTPTDHKPHSQFPKKQEQSGVYIFVSTIFSPLKTYFSSSAICLIVLLAPFHALFFPFCIYLFPPLTSVPRFFLYISSFLLFLSHFFSYPFSYFFGQMNWADITPHPGGGGGGFSLGTTGVYVKGTTAPLDENFLQHNTKSMRGISWTEARILNGFLASEEASATGSILQHRWN